MVDHLKKTSIIAIVLFLQCLLASAQLTTDQVPEARTVPSSDALRQELEQSRYHFGAARIQPLFSFRDFGYYGNILGDQNGDVSDWRATFGSGLRVIVPAGRKVYVRLNALPEYTWYRKLTERRAFGGSYGASVYALFNRIPLEFGVRQLRGVTPVSSEEQRTVLTTRNDAFARMEVHVLRRFSIFGDAQTDRPRYSLTSSDRTSGLPIEQLERNDSVGRVGVRYRFRSNFAIGFAEERTQSRFLHLPTSNNDSRAKLLLLQYDRPRTFVNIAAAARNFEPAGGALFPAFSTTTGSYFITHELGAPVTVGVYGHRIPAYSVFVQNVYFIETRNGVAADLPLGRRLTVRLQGEAGTNAYSASTITGLAHIRRSDDVTSLAAGVAFHVYRNLIWATLGSRTRYTSNLPGFDRSITRVTTSISFSGDLLR